MSDDWHKGGKRAIDDSMKQEIVDRLLAVWKENSSMRLMQLLGNVFREDAYYLEDYDMIREVEEKYNGR